MIKKETRLLILNDVVSYYNLTNRSVDSYSCLYNSPNGNHCAAARWMTNPELATEDEMIDYNRNFNLLKPEAQLAGKSFMRKIQYLHDTRENWNVEGLSEKGQIEVDKIKKNCEL